MSNDSIWKEEIMRNELIGSGTISITPIDRAIYIIKDNVMEIKHEIKQTTNETWREFTKIYLSEYENVLKKLEQCKKLKEGISAMFKYINIFDVDVDDAMHQYSFNENFGEYIESSKEDDEKIQEMIKAMKEYE